jgi:Protein of unknown function (DUF1570)
MNRGPSLISRRSWLLGTLALVAAGPPDDPRVAAIRAKGRKAAMQGFDESETTHFVGIGDAAKKFREEALTVCESVATEYFKFFTDKGFQLAWPKEKLAVVILLGPKSYAAFEGGFIDEAVGGHFDLVENRLVMFNSSGPGANPKDAIPEQDNTLKLVHETTHQLTFNSGLLNLKADIPLCVSEGLATFGETWRPRRRGTIGAKNERRLLGLKQGIEQGITWIPFKTLLQDDKLFDETKPTAQVAYAESWLFVYKLLRDHARLPKFRDYLAALREKPDPSRRLEIATEHLGDLDKLDKEVHSGK